MNRKALILLFFMCIVSCISDISLGLSDEEYERLPASTKQIFSDLSINYREIKPIYTLDDLQGIEDLTKTYLLMNDIDAVSTQQHPFITLSGRFNGYFIGQGFSILNLDATKNERVYKTVSHGYRGYDQGHGMYGNHGGGGYGGYKTSEKVLDYINPFIFEISQGNNIISLNINGRSMGKYYCGVDFVRGVENASVFGLTAPLITTASGAKMGKTAQGAVW